MEQTLSSNSVPPLDDVRSTVFLFSPDHQQVVLLQRAAWKSFAPLRWTGIGGRLEGEEVAQPALGALRELQEETGLTLADLTGWRFAADIDDPGAEVRLVYFTAIFPRQELPPCNEGTLHWVPLADYPRFDLIENTRAVLDTLLALNALEVSASLPLYGIIQRGGAAPLRLVLLSERP